jgi:hypothetical protein
MNEKETNLPKKRIFKKLLIISAIILALGLLIFLRPDKDSVIPAVPAVSDKKSVIDEMGDINALQPMEKSVKGALNDVPLQRDFVSSKIGKRGEIEKEAASAQDEKKEKDPWSARKLETNGRMSNDFSQHQGIKIKGRDIIAPEVLNPFDYPVAEPDFSKPHPLNYRGLKKVYTYFRLKDAFPKVILEKLNGAYIEMTGAVMPVDKIPEDGIFTAFWLSNPVIVLAGCVFCNPPTLADIVYVYKDSGEKPFKFEREKLFKQVVLVKVKGRLFFGPETINDQTFLFSILATDAEILN